MAGAGRRLPGWAGLVLWGVLAASCGEEGVPVDGPAVDRRWDVDGWVRAHAGQRSRVITTQSGSADPMPFAGTDWGAELAAFRAAWRDMVGPIPLSTVPLDLRVEPLDLTPIETLWVDADAYSFTKVSYLGA